MRPLGEKIFQLHEGLGGGIPVGIAQLSKAVGVEAGGSGETGAAELASADHFAQAIDQDRAHRCALSHHNVIAQR
jgi:hypothetical protein